MRDRNGLVRDIRHFNRFYTGLIGLLDETLMHSAYTLTEARVLFEIGHRPRHSATNPGGKTGFLARAFRLDVEPVASAVARDLQVDPAYVARILRRFSAAGLTEMCTGPAPLRPRVLSLTARGQAALAALHAATDCDLARLTAGLNDREAAELSDVLTRVRHLLGAAMPPEHREAP
ncbi:winged helix-turn-helix transcriptional regulator [Mesorhizobium sp. B2-3-11]|uniref:MarR family winged helix-turn-helix transcriptional regulator n=1 Tax=Mesorhizobium sp. B2-3-11 TaxID=2589953 RepID=UPI00112A00DD|nr:MarR family winged helix-turn-helix transcriptional regulator [Mesorhizobium sp. B2-3-11]TPL98141.1 winged helix-turn-helix transcriptional regulator [Mesorhizobium sp. B2-3-11]